MTTTMMAGLILFLTAASGWAQNPPPRPALKEARPLPKLSSKERCLSNPTAGEYCYELCDLEGGRKCRWVTPAEYMAHLERRKPPAQSMPFNISAGPPPWSDQEIASRLARN